jgi:tetratricopeptide (TPR) repeat protein
MKVFISSTYKDLIDYRTAAIRAVEGTNYQASKMEVFGARPDEPFDACLKEVEQSELFIGIYALRYGFIPEGADISITEMEYVHAKKLGRPIYCFILDEENQPWLQKWVEDEPGKSKLKDFKKQIQKIHVCDYFTTPDDLRAKVSNALSHYVANQHPLDSRLPIHLSTKPVGSTLPQQPFFIGRDKELDIIKSALSPESRTWGALIDGPGGIGKTALAIHAAHLAPATLFERKIFITAKVRELTPEGEKPLKDFTRDNYFSMLNELALELGEEGIPRLAPDERTNALRMAMIGKKTLIVFDNLETLIEDERTRLFQFLSRLPEGNKAIVTSRRRADVDARVIRLDRLSAEESLQLMEELAINNPRLARENEKAHRDLYEITNGNPLLIKWVCAQLGREGSAMHTIAETCKFIENAPKGNDPLEYVFGDLLETLTESETKVLAALTHFTQPAKLKWIADMTGLAEQAAETALEDLVDRSILIANNESNEFFLPPLPVHFIRSRHPKTVNKTGDRLIDYAYAVVLQNGGNTNYEGFRIIEVEWVSIAAALQIISRSKKLHISEMCNKLYFFLIFSGRLDELLWISNQAEVEALAEKNLRQAGGHAIKSGIVCLQRNQANEIYKYADRAEAYWQNETIRIKYRALRLRALGYDVENRFEDSIDLLNQIRESLSAIAKNGREVCIILTDLADVQMHSGDFEAAKSYYEEVQRIFVERNDLEGLTMCSLGLASILAKQGAWEETESLANTALKLAEKIGRKSSMAKSSTLMAKALLHQGHATDALQHAARAVEILTTIHSKSLQIAQKLLEECEATIQAEDEKKLHESKKE